MKARDEIIQTVTSNEMREVTIDMVKQIAREYATEVAKQVLHDAAENAMVLLQHPVFGNEEYKSVTSNSGVKYSIYKESILNTSIKA